MLLSDKVFNSISFCFFFYYCLNKTGCLSFHFLTKESCQAAPVAIFFIFLLSTVMKLCLEGYFQQEKKITRLPTHLATH